MITVTKKSDRSVLLVDLQGVEHTIVNKDLVLIEKYKYDSTNQSIRIFVPDIKLNIISNVINFGNIDGNVTANRTVDTTIDLLRAVFEGLAASGGGGSTDVSSLNKETTQAAIKTATEKLATNSPSLSNGKVPVTGDTTNPDLGTQADSPATVANYTGAKSLISIHKFIASLLNDTKALLIKGRDVMANSLSVSLASDHPPVITGVLPPVPIAVTQVAAFNLLYVSMDASMYKTMLIQLYGTFTAVLEVQASNDNTNWTNVVVSKLQTGAQLSAMSTAGLYSVNINYQYFRIRIKSFTSGTPTVNLFGCYDYKPQPTGTVNIGSFDGGGNTSAYGLISAASVNLNLVKSGNLNVNMAVLSNTTAAFKYVRMYDKGTTPAATDTPKYRFALAPNSTLSITPSVGLAFVNGLGIGITGASPDNDATAVALGDVIINLNYA